MRCEAPTSHGAKPWSFSWGHYQLRTWHMICHAQAPAVPPLSRLKCHTSANKLTAHLPLLHTVNSEALLKLWKCHSWHHKTAKMQETCKHKFERITKINRSKTTNNSNRSSSVPNISSKIVQLLCCPGLSPVKNSNLSFPSQSLGLFFFILNWQWLVNHQRLHDLATIWWISSI